MSQQVDTLFTGGSVFLPGADSSVPSAVAVTGGRIAAVGPDDELASWPEPDTEVVDLAGGLLLPGFQDAHVHPVMGGLAMLQCELHGTTSAQQCLDIVARVRRGEPRPRVDRRRRLVDGVLPRRHPDPAGPRRGRARSAGLPDQPRRPRQLGQHRGARARRHRRRHSRSRRRPDRARRRTARRPARCTRVPVTSSAACCPSQQRRGHVRRAAGRPGAAVLPRHHRLAGRRCRATASGSTTSSRST